MKSSKFVLWILVFGAMHAMAAAPMSTANNSGVYRFKLGEFQIHVISDGTAKLPMGKLLTHLSPKEIKAALAKNFLEETIETSVDTFLVNTGTKLILIDTGAGGGFGDTGHLLDNLKAAGYKPEQVDAVLITHAHGDHIGGLSTKNGVRVFQNATLYIGKGDVDYFTDPKNKEAAPPDKKGAFDALASAIEPYAKAGQLKSIDKDMDITIGVRARGAHGHTPGHTNYEIQSDGQKLIHLGDTIHVASVQFENPSACIQFDSDQKAAEKYRKMIFAEAAKKGDMIAAAHLPFPGTGHLRVDKKGGYTFVPINYSR